MPRIPSAAQVSSVGGAASRLPAVRADAAAFGLANAQGIAALGEGVDETGTRIVQEARLAEAEEQAEAAKQVADEARHRAEVRESAIRMAETWEYDGRPPREAAARARRELEAFEDSRLAEARPERRAGLKAATELIRRGQALRIAQRVQNLSVAALNRQTEETLQLLQKQAAREPQAAAHYEAEGRAQLRSLEEAGALTSEQLTVQEESFRRELYTAVVRGQPARDALSDLQDGVYDDGLGGAGLKRFLLQETAWRLQSERAQGNSMTEAQLVRVRQGEALSPGLPPGMRLSLVADELVDAERRVGMAARVRSELQRLRFAPEIEIEKHVDALAASVDETEVTTQQEVRRETWIQSRAMLRERAADPAAFVMEQPSVTQAFAAAEANPALLPDAVSLRLAAQAAMGLAPEAQRALTLAERGQILAGLQRLQPVERIVALRELGEIYGDQSAAVVADLAAAGLSLAEQLAADPSGDAAVARRLAQAVEESAGSSPAEGGPVGDAVERLLGAARDA